MRAHLQGRSASGGWRDDGYFASRWKGAGTAPPENSRRTAIAAAPQPVSWIALREGRVGPHSSKDLPMPGVIIPIPSRHSSTTVESRPIGLLQLSDDPLAQNRWSMQTQVVVEVAKRRHEREQFDPRRLCSLGQD